MIRRSRLISNQRRRQPSIQHEREPNTPLPIESCHCDVCENARIDQDDRIGRVMGSPEPMQEKGEQS